MMCEAPVANLKDKDATKEVLPGNMVKEVLSLATENLDRSFLDRIDLSPQPLQISISQFQSPSFLNQTS